MILRENSYLLCLMNCPKGNAPECSSCCTGSKIPGMSIAALSPVALPRRPAIADVPDFWFPSTKIGRRFTGHGNRSLTLSTTGLTILTWLYSSDCRSTRQHVPQAYEIRQNPAMTGPAVRGASGNVGRRRESDNCRASQGRFPVLVLICGESAHWKAHAPLNNDLRNSVASGVKWTALSNVVCA